MYEMRSAPTVENILAFYDLCVDCNLEDLGQKYLSTLILRTEWTRNVIDRQEDNGIKTWNRSAIYHGNLTLCLNYDPPKDDRKPCIYNLWHSIENQPSETYVLQVYVYDRPTYMFAKSYKLPLLEFIKLLTATADALPSLLEPYRVDKPAIVSWDQ